MKKTLILPIGILTLSLMGLASCNLAHKHAYGSSWEKDGTHHWHTCEGANCSGISDKAEHSGGTATEIKKAKCEVCGNEYGSVLPHTHVYSEEVVHEDYLVSVADCDSKVVYKKSCACGEAGTETFEFGDDASDASLDNSGKHSDGSRTALTEYSESNNGYTLELSEPSAVYKSAKDDKGFGCLKFGKTAEAGSCSFTVSDDINLVIIYIAKYKNNETIVIINGETTTLTKNSNDGEYDIIEVDTSSEKTVTITTESGGFRAMLNTIKFINNY